MCFSCTPVSLRYPFAIMLSLNVSSYASFFSEAGVKIAEFPREIGVKIKEQDPLILGWLFVFNVVYLLVVLLAVLCCRKTRKPKRRSVPKRPDDGQAAVPAADTSAAQAQTVQPPAAQVDTAVFDVIYTEADEQMKRVQGEIQHYNAKAREWKSYQTAVAVQHNPLQGEVDAALMQLTDNSNLDDEGRALLESKFEHDTMLCEILSKRHVTAGSIVALYNEIIAAGEQLVGLYQDQMKMSTHLKQQYYNDGVRHLNERRTSSNNVAQTISELQRQIQDAEKQEKTNRVEQAKTGLTPSPVFPV